MDQNKDGQLHVGAGVMRDGEPPEPVFCDLCGAQMEEKHCKIRCNDCGYLRDCSDP